MAGRARWWRLPPHRMVLVAGCAAALAIVTLDGWRTWQARGTVLAMDNADTLNLAMSLASRIQDVIEKCDMFLVDMRERVLDDGTAGQHGGRIRAVMLEDLKNRPALQDLFIFDAAGAPLLATDVNVAEALDIGGRDEFRHHQQSGEPGVRLWEPVWIKSTGRWILPISRRITNPDGGFGGIVLAAISIDGLNAVFSMFDVGAHGSITLITTGGILIARSPTRENQTGFNLADSRLFADIRQHPGTGSVRYTSPMDGMKREGSYAALADYPLEIIVAHGISDLLENWRSDAIQHLTLSAGAALAQIVFGMAFSRQIKIHQAADRRFRMLTENSNDIIMGFTRSGQKLYVSPAAVAMTGWSIEENMAWNWAAMAHPDDRAGVLAVIAQLDAGAGSVNCTYRIIRKDGTVVWVEARTRTANAGDGDGIAFIANIRDISTRKAAEDKIETLNAELLKLATTDALTGLANRRRFDIALTEEWQRAYREGTPLSLLMLDIDRFKLFNDHYGHQRGDGCLQVIAAAIADCVRRPGDLVARYGGEEIAVLLPRCHAAGAAATAERVREAIEAAGIEHLENLPSAVVTASVGAATTTPLAFSGSGGSRALVAAADEALYQAKRAGRNRVVEAGSVPATT